MSPKFIFIPSSVAPAQFLLDIYPNAEAAYSIRKLRTGVDTLLRIRRSSDDAETDVDVDAGGLTISLTSPVSAGGNLGTWIGSDDGFVTTRYDQTGNGNNQVQSVVTDQPKIITAGVIETLNSQPAILGDGVSDFLATPAYMIPETGDILVSVHGVYKANVAGTSV